METKKPWAIDLRYFTPVAKAVYLHDVDVDPQFQRLGVGRQLLVHATTAAREWPVDAIRVDAYDGLSGGGPFYERCGFTEVGRTVYRGVPLIYFEFVMVSEHQPVGTTVGPCRESRRGETPANTALHPTAGHDRGRWPRVSAKR
jgi:predicted N-acetyltransferase YhbS